MLHFFPSTSLLAKKRVWICVWAMYEIETFSIIILFEVNEKPYYKLETLSEQNYCIKLLR